MPEKDLPVKLPDVKNYAPTGTGSHRSLQLKMGKCKMPDLQGVGQNEKQTRCHSGLVHVGTTFTAIYGSKE